MFMVNTTNILDSMYNLDLHIQRILLIPLRIVYIQINILASEDHNIIRYQDINLNASCKPYLPYPTLNDASYKPCTTQYHHTLCNLLDHMSKHLNQCNHCLHRILDSHPYIYIVIGILNCIYPSTLKEKHIRYRSLSCRRSRNRLCILKR